MRSSFHRLLDAPRRAAVPARHILLGLAAVILALVVTSCAGGDQASGTGGGKELTVPLQVVQGQNGAVQALVPVTIDGQGPYAFTLDTGASTSLVDKTLVDRLHLQVVGQAAEVTGVTGSEKARLIKLDNWTAGNVQLPTVIATDLPLPGSDVQAGMLGLLGSDVLSRFGAVTVDYIRQVLVLRDRK